MLLLLGGALNLMALGDSAVTPPEKTRVNDHGAPALPHVDRLALLGEGSGRPKGGKPAEPSHLEMTDPYKSAHKDSGVPGVKLAAAGASDASHPKEAGVKSKPLSDHGIDKQVGQVKGTLKGGIPVVQNLDATANALEKAPAAEQQRIFSEAAKKYVKANPKANPENFVHVLGTSLQSIPNNTLSSNMENGLAFLHDDKAKTDSNPSGLVAKEFLGGSGKLDTVDKNQFETGRKIAQDVADAKKILPPAEQGSFHNRVDSMLKEIGGDLRSSYDRGVFAPPKDTGAPPKPANAPNAADLSRSLKTSFANNPSQASDSTFDNAAHFGSQIASAKPAAIQGIFTKAMDTLKQDNRKGTPLQHALMLATAANTFSGTKNFGASAENSPSGGQLLNLSDKQIATNANKGIVARALELDGQSAGDKAAIDAAMKIAADVREGAAALPPDDQGNPEAIRSYAAGVLHRFDELRTD